MKILGVWLVLKLLNFKGILNRSDYEDSYGRLIISWHFRCEAIL